MGTIKHLTVKQALESVAARPQLETDDLLQLPVHELICRELFEIANRPDAAVRGSMARANRARKLILNRMVGRRRAGTAPASHEPIQLDFIDLTEKPEELP